MLEKKAVSVQQNQVTNRKKQDIKWRYRSDYLLTRQNNATDDKKSLVEELIRATGSSCYFIFSPRMQLSLEGFWNTRITNGTAIVPRPSCALTAPPHPRYLRAGPHSALSNDST